MAKEAQVTSKACNLLKKVASREYCPGSITLTAQFLLKEPLLKSGKEGRRTRTRRMEEK
jgi:hypothetical protein